MRKGRKRGNCKGRERGRYVTETRRKIVGKGGVGKVKSGYGREGKGVREGGGKR